MRKSFIAIIASAALALSCSAPKQIPYFQDLGEGENSMTVQPLQLVLQPEDKINIIVTCKDPQLSALFNLPYNSRIIGSTSSDATSGGGGQGVCGYTIKSDGTIDFPIIGFIHVAGLSREQVAAKIKNELITRNLIKDPVVTVDYMNLMFSVIGDVSHPGRFGIPKDHMNIIDAIALAGDLSVTGQRRNIRVIREKDGVQMTYVMDMCNMQNLITSPAYYIQQNDIIYVEPNMMKRRQSTVNGNSLLSVSFWMSVASFLTSLTTTFIVTNK